MVKKVELYLSSPKRHCNIREAMSLAQRKGPIITAILSQICREALHWGSHYRGVLRKWNLPLSPLALANFLPEREQEIEGKERPSIAAMTRNFQ